MPDHAGIEIFEMLVRWVIRDNSEVAGRLSENRMRYCGNAILAIFPDYFQNLFQNGFTSLRPLFSDSSPGKYCYVFSQIAIA